MVKSRNDECLYFNMFYGIIQPFLETSTSNVVHIFISRCHLTYMRVYSVFLTILILWDFFFLRKKTILKMLIFYSKFQKSEIAVL